MDEHIRRTYTTLKGFLEPLSVVELRALGVEALRIWRRRPKQRGYQRPPLEQFTEDLFSLDNDFGQELIRLVTKHPNIDDPAMLLAFTDDAAMHTSWMSGVLEFIWWLQRAGLAVPVVFGEPRMRNAGPHNTRWYPSVMRLTARGVQLVEGTDDNPLLPGFLDRVRQRCPDLPDEVVALLLDARTCLDHMLLRPAVTVLGVAYETAVELVASVLVARGQLPPAVQDQNSAKRISWIRGVVDQVMPGSTPQERDDRFATHRALGFCDDIRRRRYDASHTSPTYGFDDRGETEELLAGAGRHLPNLWRLRL